MKLIKINALNTKFQNVIQKTYKKYCCKIHMKKIIGDKICV